MNAKKTCLMCSKPARSRGLCQTHYSQFNRIRNQLREEDRDGYEAASIAAGKLLPASSKDNEFLAIAESLVSYRIFDSDENEAEDTAKKKLRSVRADAAPSGANNKRASSVGPSGKNPRRPSSGDSVPPKK